MASSIWLMYSSKTNTVLFHIFVFFCACLAIFYNSLANFYTCESHCIWMLQFVLVFFFCAKISEHSQSSLANNRHKFLLLLQFSLRMGNRHLWFVGSFHVWSWGFICFVFVGLFWDLQFFFCMTWRLKCELLHSIDKFYINYVHWMADLIGKMSENNAVKEIIIMNMHSNPPFQLSQSFESLILKTRLHSSK